MTQKDTKLSNEEDRLNDRLNSHQIFQRILVDADEEIARGWRELIFSSIAAGFAITLTFLLYVQMYAQYGGDSILRAALYPIGFVFIVLGNYQLFTENTLPPVALTIERISSVPALLVMWVLVLAGNVIGVTIGVASLAYGNFFSPSAIDTAIKIGQEGIEHQLLQTFLKGTFAGLVVAGVVWLDFSFRNETARLLLIYFAFLTIPLGGMFHIVVSTAEVMFLVFIGRIVLINGIFQFLLPVFFGNIFGGVVLVTVVNYYQTSDYIQKDSGGRLPTREWLLSYNTGREKKEIFGENTSK